MKLKSKSKLFVLLSAVLLTVGATNVWAQEKNGDANNGQVTLNIKLHQIQTLVVNQGQATVNLDYKTKEDYANGVSSEVLENHLTAFSTGGFKIMASTTSDLINGKNSIASGDIKLTASKGAGNASIGEANTIESLTKDGKDHILVSSNEGGRYLNFDVQYSAKGEDVYINKYVQGENPTVYTTTVTYTITAL